MHSVCVPGEHTLTLTSDALHTLVTHTHVQGCAGAQVPPSPSSTFPCLRTRLLLVCSIKGSSRRWGLGKAASESFRFFPG